MHCVDQERREILKWLVTTDPSSNHNAAFHLHEPHTGKWFFGSPEYKDWLTGSTSHLWLHGIPGAGKTVLLSSIVEKVQDYCKSQTPKDIACAYYYCYFHRSQDEAPHMLRWVLSQLCRQSNFVPDEVQELFHNGTEPGIPQLISALSAVLHRFRRVYVLVDALDESLDRRKLLNVLKTLMSSNFRKLRVLAMSRKEQDIEQALQNISCDISLSNARVDEDIRLYVHNIIRNDQRFMGWSSSLRNDVEDSLVGGAKGM